MAKFGGSQAGWYSIKKKPRRRLTDEEIIKIEAWSAIRIPMESMAALLNMAVSQLENEINRRPEIQQAIASGRAKGKLKPVRTLYERATGREAYTDEKGKFHEAIPVDFQALKFWLQTQEGFKTSDKVEISGPNGAPIETKECTREELEARLLLLKKQNELTSDE